ncbi:MAG: hypothetical protein Q8M53_10845 [Burkholderiales bacterium]|nr:hypothetical protein [Burkholderiales bacterium]
MTATNPIKTIRIDIDLDALQSYADEYLAVCWHVAQANPASSFDSPEPGIIAEHVGREIIRRWLKEIPPQLWNVQGSHFAFGEKQRLVQSAAEGRPV